MELLTFMQKHILLLSAMASTVLLIVRDSMRSKTLNQHILSQDDAKALIDQGVKIYDMRSAEDFRSAHIDGSKRIRAEKLLQNPQKYIKDGNMKVILVCQSGLQSRALCLQLRQKHGYDVYCIDGGFDNWGNSSHNNDQSALDAV